MFRKINSKWIGVSWFDLQVSAEHFPKGLLNIQIVSPESIQFLKCHLERLLVSCLVSPPEEEREERGWNYRSEGPSD